MVISNFISEHLQMGINHWSDSEVVEKIQDLKTSGSDKISRL